MEQSLAENSNLQRRNAIICLEKNKNSANFSEENEEKNEEKNAEKNEEKKLESEIKINSDQDIKIIQENIRKEKIRNILSQNEKFNMITNWIKIGIAFIILWVTFAIQYYFIHLYQSNYGTISEIIKNVIFARRFELSKIWLIGMKPDILKGEKFEKSENMENYENNVQNNEKIVLWLKQENKGLIKNYLKLIYSLDSIELCKIANQNQIFKIQEDECLKNLILRKGLYESIGFYINSIRNHLNYNENLDEDKDLLYENCIFTKMLKYREKSNWINRFCIRIEQ